MRRAEFLVTLALGLSIAGSAAFGVAFARGGPLWLLGLGFGGALLAIGLALAFWAKWLLPAETVEDVHAPLVSNESERREALVEMERGMAEVVGRRRWLARLGWSSLAALLAAALFPLRSLGPAPPAANFPSRWRKGLRLVREDGRALTHDAVAEGTLLTAFPEGSLGPDRIVEMGNNAVVVTRVDAAKLRLRGERARWAPHGLVAYSKVCTHAGCPLGLYRREEAQIMCPCHQSIFDVLDGGSVVFGPAVKPLPQLPLAVAADGTLRAAGALSAPIGPDAWSGS